MPSRTPSQCRLSPTTPRLPRMPLRRTCAMSGLLGAGGLLSEGCTVMAGITVDERRIHRCDATLVSDWKKREPTDARSGSHVQGNVCSLHLERDRSRWKHWGFHPGT